MSEEMKDDGKALEEEIKKPQLEEAPVAEEAKEETPVAEEAPKEEPAKEEPKEEGEANEQIKMLMVARDSVSVDGHEDQMTIVAIDKAISWQKKKLEKK